MIPINRKHLALGIAALLAGVLATPAGAGTISGTVTSSGGGTATDAVVYVEEIPGKSFPAPEEPATMDQVGMEFVPHVLPIQVGTTVEFHNSDSVTHNVFTIDECADMFDLGSWGGGASKSYTFEKPCTAVILCNLHPEMEAFVVAVPTPYFAVTAPDGTYRIEGVPDGTLTMKVWHPNLKSTQRELSLEEEAELDFTLER